MSVTGTLPVPRACHPLPCSHERVIHPPKYITVTGHGHIIFF